jgi:hypothetical protein
LEQKADLPRPPFAGLGCVFENPGTLEPNTDTGGGQWRYLPAVAIDIFLKSGI